MMPLTTQQKDLLAIVALQVQIVNGKQTPIHALAIARNAALVEHTLWRRLHNELIDVPNDIALRFAVAADAAAAAAIGRAVAALDGGAVLVGRGNVGGTHCGHARYVAIGIVVFVQRLVERLLATAQAL